MRVREGDLLIMATDGVFDNLFQDEILDIVKNVTRDNTKNKMTASVLSQ
jgi:serine/threonine protein phosphatase PrpC